MLPATYQRRRERLLDAVARLEPEATCSRIAEAVGSTPTAVRQLALRMAGDELLSCDAGRPMRFTVTDGGRASVVDGLSGGGRFSVHPGLHLLLITDQLPGHIRDTLDEQSVRAVWTARTFGRVGRILAFAAEDDLDHVENVLSRAGLELMRLTIGALESPIVEQLRVGSGRALLRGAAT